MAMAINIVIISKFLINPQKFCVWKKKKNASTVLTPPSYGRQSETAKAK